MHHLSGHNVPIFDPRHELNTIPVCNQSFLCSHSSASLLVLLPATWKALSAPVVLCSCLGSHLGVAGDGDCLPCAHPRWRIADWVALGLGSEQEETLSGLGHLVHTVFRSVQVSQALVLFFLSSPETPRNGVCFNVCTVLPGIKHLISNLIGNRAADLWLA